MRSIGIAVIDLKNEVAGKLGKKGSESDYTIYNRKSDELVMCIYEPTMWPEKLVSLLHSFNSADFVLLVFDGLGREIGEAIVAIDTLGMKGFVCFRDGMKEDFLKIAKGTAAERLEECEYEPSKILAKLESLDVPRNENAPLRVTVDQSFVVKSVGLVVLGIVKSGKVNVHERLKIIPSGKEAEVRSVQVQDKDVTASVAGDRVGLCLKNLSVEEIGRGDELVTIDNLGQMEGSRDISAFAELNKFQKAPIQSGTDVFVSYGTQFAAARVGSELLPGEGSPVRLQFQKPFAFKKGEIALLADISRPLRIIGKARL